MATKRHFTIQLWRPVRLFATISAFLDGCGGPWWDVSRPALNLMEDILNSFYKCTLSAVTQKLNVSWDVFYGYIFFILNSRPKCVPILQLHTLYSAKLFWNENVRVNCNSTQCTFKRRVRQGIINKIIKITMDFFPYNIQKLNSHPPNCSLLGDKFSLLREIKVYTERIISINA
jgi:hypothetical protein